MLVRVYDKERGVYFKSEVYAILRVNGYTQYLVLIPDEEVGRLKLFGYLDKTSAAPSYHVLVNIVTPQEPETWVSKDGEALLKINEALSGGSININSYQGFDWLLDNPEIMTVLLRGESVPADFEGFRKTDSHLSGWNYINTQDDIDFLMESARGFHDSCLEALEYVSGAYVWEDKSMYPMDSIRTLKMTIGSQYCGRVELVFEGLLGLNLRPAGDNRDSIIYSAALRVKDEAVLFADWDLDSDDLSESGTCAKALSLRWRFIERDV